MAKMRMNPTFGAKPYQIHYFDYGSGKFVPVLGCAGSNRLQRHLEVLAICYSPSANKCNFGVAHLTFW